MSGIPAQIPFLREGEGEGVGKFPPVLSQLPVEAGGASLTHRKWMRMGPALGACPESVLVC